MASMARPLISKTKADETEGKTNTVITSWFGVATIQPWHYPQKPTAICFIARMRKSICNAIFGIWPELMMKWPFAVFKISGRSARGNCPISPNWPKMSMWHPQSCTRSNYHKYQLRASSRVYANLNIFLSNDFLGTILFYLSLRTVLAASNHRWLFHKLL